MPSSSMSLSSPSEGTIMARAMNALSASAALAPERIVRIAAVMASFILNDCSPPLIRSRQRFLSSVCPASHRLNASESFAMRNNKSSCVKLVVKRTGALKLRKMLGTGLASTPVKVYVAEA